MLIDAALNKKLQLEGYVVMDYFSGHELQSTLGTIKKDLGEPNFVFLGDQNDLANSSFHITFLDKNTDYKQTVWNHLTKMVQDFVDDRFVGHRFIQANIINKPPSTGYVYPHQNLTTVDEERFTSLSIWIPFQDTNKLNGALHVVPRSHGKFEKYRNANICWSPLNASVEIAVYGMIPIEMKKGQVLVFDDSLIHASPINHSDSDRLAFHFLVIPNEAKPVYCYRKGNHMNVIEVEESFWQTSSPSDQQPSGNLVKTVAYEEQQYSLQDLMPKH